ncbi:hypothetical protein [Shewanella fidelis]|uniref:hypothetical protein n=1 Tax=Shewanella fidelis TaxID=173509 RepID=UPI00048FCB0F|nr:hypothetical protein [Shewanella fidelis]
MVALNSRGETIHRLIESFLLDDRKDLVSFKVVEDLYCIVFEIQPKNKMACGLELTVGLNGDEHLTILIGDKIVYEEYEGITLPEDNVFIGSLLLAVSEGNVEEVYMKKGSQIVAYKAFVHIDGELDIIIGDKMPLEPNNMLEIKTVNYQPW